MNQPHPMMGYGVYLMAMRSISGCYSGIQQQTLQRMRCISLVSIILRVSTIKCGEIMAQVNFEGSLPAFFVFVRENQSLRFPNTDEGREAYLTSARDALSRMEKKLPDYFGVLPKAELIVKRVEAVPRAKCGESVLIKARHPMVLGRVSFTPIFTT